MTDEWTIIIFGLIVGACLLSYAVGVMTGKAMGRAQMRDEWFASLKEDNENAA